MNCNCESTAPAATEQTAGAQRVSAREVFKPLVDIFETDNEFVVLGDFPGVKENDVDVRFEDGTLNIRARVADRPMTGKRPLSQEYGIGDFERSFRIGDGIAVEQISAELANGVLTLHLPKIERVKARKITVRTS